jgi:hypothetical protein
MHLALLSSHPNRLSSASLRWGFVVIEMISSALIAVRQIR